MAKRPSERHRLMPLEEAQRLLDTFNLKDARQQIEGPLTKATNTASTTVGYIRSQSQEANLRFKRVTRLGQKRKLLQDRWREIATNFLRYHFGRDASRRILNILHRQERRIDARVADADALCKTLLDDSRVQEVGREIDLGRNAFGESDLLKLGDAANAMCEQMGKFRDVISLVGDITSANYNIQSGCDAHYHDFENLLRNDYQQFALEDNYPAEAEAYTKLQEVLVRMGNIRLAPRLATRSMCAVAGGFSSGKSSFLNSLIGSRTYLLPTRITPTTSIATYIFHIKGAEQSINVFNHNGGSVEIEPNMFQEMTHDFKASYGIQLKRLVERVSIYTPKLADWNNVALIDTPGYTNPDEPEGVDSDEEIALRSVWKSQFLIWLVDCEKGTLPEQDVELMRKFQQQGDQVKGGELIYLVINKADKKPKDQLESVLNQVAETVKKHQIPCFGIGLYSAHQAKWYGHEGQSFEDFLSKIGQAEAVNMEALSDEVEQVFDKYVEYHSTEQVRLGNALGLMKRLLLGVDTQQSKNQRGRRKTAPSALEDSLNEHIQALSREIDKHKQWAEKAKGLRTRFLQAVEGFVDEIDSLRNVR